MTAKRWDGSAWQDITAIKRWDGSAWQNIASGKRWDGASFVEWWAGGGGTLLAFPNASYAHGYYYCNSEGVYGACPMLQTVFTSEVTVTVEGETGSVSYLWEPVGLDGGFTATSPTAATTDFSARIRRNEVATSTWKCTVTDDLESVVVTVDLLVEYYHEDGGVEP